MNVIIRKALVSDPRSVWNGQRVDIYLKGQKIEKIAPHIDAEASETIDVPDLVVSPGFTDIFSHFHDPGQEHKETLETGALAARAGGYNRVLVLPNTKPAVHSKSLVEYIIQKSRHLPVDILPLGAISQNCEGKELAEMHDMHQSGAVAFSDGIQPVQNSQVLLKALQYVKAFEGIVIQIPDEQNLSRTGLVNEGIVSTRLGLPGKPALAETLMLARDIELLRYTQSRLHVTGLSTADSIELVRRPKNDGIDLTCSVTPYHLWFSDEDLAGYDTNLKVNPPLRTPADVEALRQAVTDGTIDCIASHHQPHEWDSKVCEFEYAKYGMEGLESCFGATTTALPSLDPQMLARLFSIHPSGIFGLSLPLIEEKEKVNLTVYQKNTAHTFEAKDIRSRSVNNAFAGSTFNTTIISTFLHK